MASLQLEIVNASQDINQKLVKRIGQAKPDLLIVATDELSWADADPELFIKYGEIAMYSPCSGTSPLPTLLTQRVPP